MPESTATMNVLPDAFVIGSWRVLRSQNRLEHVETSGRVERLEPKAMDVLCLLAARAGHTVSRDELLEAVWLGRPVVEGVLTRVIRSLRRQLGDDARTPRYIETVTKRGYRLLVEPQVAAAPPDLPLPVLRTAPSRNLRWSAFAAALGAAFAMIWMLSAKPTSSDAGTPTMARARVLWVDDRPENNRAEIAQLNELGITVVTVTSNQDAAAALRGSDYDMLISDIHRSNHEAQLAGLALPREVVADRNNLPPVVYYVGTARSPRTEDGYPVTTESGELLRLVANLMPQAALNPRWN